MFQPSKLLIFSMFSPMIFQDSSLMHTVIYSENLKKFPIKHKTMEFTGFALQAQWLWYYQNCLYYRLFLGNDSQAVLQRFFERNLFRKTFSSTHYLFLEKTIRIVNFIHNLITLSICRYMNNFILPFLIYMLIKIYFSLVSNFILLLIARWLNPKNCLTIYILRASSL